MPAAFKLYRKVASLITEPTIILALAMILLAGIAKFTAVPCEKDVVYTGKRSLKISLKYDPRCLM